MKLLASKNLLELENHALEQPARQQQSPSLIKDFFVIFFLCLAFYYFDGYFIFRDAVWPKPAPVSYMFGLYFFTALIVALICTNIFRYSMRKKKSYRLFFILSVSAFLGWFLIRKYLASISGSSTPSPYGLLTDDGLTLLGHVRALFNPYTFMALYAGFLLLKETQAHSRNSLKKD